MFDFARMRALIKIVPKKLFDIEKAESAACRVTAELTDMPKSHNAGDRLALDAIMISELRAAYEESLQELDQMKRELSPLISKLPDAEERAVMRLRYICGHSPDSIADSELVPMSRATVYRYLRKSEQTIRQNQ